MRESKKIKTSGGTEVEIYTYLTFGESRKIQGIYLESMKINLDDGGTPVVSDIQGEIANKSQDETIRLLVKSVGGKSDNVLEAVNNMPQKEGEEVIKAINDITGSESKKKATE